MLSSTRPSRALATYAALLCAAGFVGCSARTPSSEMSPDMSSGGRAAEGTSGASAGISAGGAGGAAPKNGGSGATATVTAGSSGTAGTSVPAAQSGSPAAGASGGAAGAGTKCEPAGTGTAQGSGPRLDVVLAPHRSGETVDYVDVSLTIEAPNARASAPLLRLPMVFAGVESARYQSADLRVEDAMGTLPLSQVDDAVDPTNFQYYRRWRADRATKGDLTVRYRAPTRAFIPVLGSGPPFDLRSEGGGLAGAGVSFLALPDTSSVYRIGLRWDLAGMPANARGVFSRGEGDVAVTGPVDLLAYAFYLAGPVSSYPDCAKGPFQAFWLSQPPFDVQSVAQWTERAYREISTFFRDPDKQYRVFFRHNEAGAIGGAALSGSFMVGYGDAPAPVPERLRAMFAHEIVHNWPTPLHDTASEWFGEGMAEHYSAAITLRAGLITPDEFLAGLNAQALSYYANPLRQLPATEIADRFWSDTRVRKIPYDRGALYLASVDAAVRARSSGARKLDDLTFAMLDRLQGGQSYDSAAWVQLVNRELGADGRTQYEAMVAGELLAPPSDAFGPCFRNEATTYPQFELGFDPAVLAKVPRTVTTVVAGSTAEQAGLRTGDEITSPIVLDDVLTNPTAQLTLKVRRGTEAKEISYLPRGAAVSGYRWTRVAGVPDGDCAK
ncbi:MAG TPA: hypothetical protein VJV78_00850 [Polyangiales bacterium]|nr:hypothetical protein [Polyangiales bacterium]